MSVKSNVLFDIRPMHHVASICEKDEKQGSERDGGRNCTLMCSPSLFFDVSIIPHMLYLALKLHKLIPHSLP